MDVGFIINYLIEWKDKVSANNSIYNLTNELLCSIWNIFIWFSFKFEFILISICLSVREFRFSYGNVLDIESKWFINASVYFMAYKTTN